MQVRLQRNSLMEKVLAVGMRITHPSRGQASKQTAAPTAANMMNAAPAQAHTRSHARMPPIMHCTPAHRLPAAHKAHGARRVGREWTALVLVAAGRGA
jgi:hypothetical protein